MIKECHVGVKGLVLVNGRCLVLQSGTGTSAYWDVPGGRIDDAETLRETLLRELHEELPSIKKFTPGEVVGAYRLGTDIQEGKGLVFIFYRVDADEFEVTLSSEHCAYRWISKETLFELQNSSISINPDLYILIESVLK